MESVVVNHMESLYQQCQDRRIFIYGAKTAAQRTYYYLESRGVTVDSFIVSNRYDNPCELLGKRVQRIEEMNQTFDCMVVAVNPGLVWDIAEELQGYPIQKMVVIGPCLTDELPASYAGHVLSENSKISEKAVLFDGIQLFSDDTSTIVIEENAVVCGGVYLQ